MILLVSTREARWSCIRPSPAAPSVSQVNSQEGMAALEAVRSSAFMTAASAAALAGVLNTWRTSSAGSAPLSSAAASAALQLDSTQITDAGCSALATALDCGALPALEDIFLRRIPASAAAEAAVQEALKRTASRAAMPSIR